MRHDEKEKIALWRLGVLGPLISARLEHGDRRRYLEEAAARLQQQPDGTYVQLSPRTIESWYYAYRHGGFPALFPQDRADRGHSRAISAEIAEQILRVKRERPRRSIRRIIRMLERAQIVPGGTLHRSAVHRLLRAHHLSSRPQRNGGAERRSFLPEHAGDLWVGDALHGPLVIAPDGSLRKAYLLSQIDGATRFVPHSYFALSESAVDQEYGLQQAILKHGLPRTYYVDLGAAYIADSLQLICAELGIRLLHTQVQDCEAKGVIERWHRTWREEVGDELPDQPLPLAELNAKHWAWLSAEYHARPHTTTGRSPREHWLAELPFLRPVPRPKNLGDVFLHRERRVVRKDGTVRFRGGYLEVRPELVGQEVELRFDPHDDTARPRVFLENSFVCDTVPLDRVANASRQRRHLGGEASPDTEPSGLDPLALIEAEHYDRVRPVGQPHPRTKKKEE
ncbi:MAG: helix-turn-helix domain-containing protein [Candidatus Sulfotelmatobacter sp.]